MLLSKRDQRCLKNAIMKMRSFVDPGKNSASLSAIIQQLLPLMNRSTVSREQFDDMAFACAEI